MQSFVPSTILQRTTRREGGNNHIKELIKEARKSQGENTIKGTNFAGLHHMTFLC